MSIAWMRAAGAGFHDVPSGVYFLKWDDGRVQAAGKVVIVQ
jgi:hypothetical protein